MEAERYQELEDRERMLQLLYDKLGEARGRGSAALELMVYEAEGEAGLSKLGRREVNTIGDQLGISEPDAVGLFKRLQPRHLIGGFHNPKPKIPYYKVRIDNLSDDGMATIGKLPAQDQLINAFREVIEIAEDPETPGTPKQKRETIEWANTGISLVRNIMWIADKLKDNLS